VIGPKTHNIRGERYTRVGGEAFKVASCPGAGKPLVNGRCSVCNTISKAKVNGMAPAHNIPAWMREKDHDLT
jgi:hypothetical protein